MCLIPKSTYNKGAKIVIKKTQKKVNKKISTYSKLMYVKPKLYEATFGS